MLMAYIKELIIGNFISIRSRFSWEKVEDLKMEHCYIAPDYSSEAKIFQVMTLSHGANSGWLLNLTLAAMVIERNQGS